MRLSFRSHDATRYWKPRIPTTRLQARNTSRRLISIFIEWHDFRHALYNTPASQHWELLGEGSRLQHRQAPNTGPKNRREDTLMKTGIMTLTRLNIIVELAWFCFRLIWQSRTLMIFAFFSLLRAYRHAFRPLSCMRTTGDISYFHNYEIFLSHHWSLLTSLCRLWMPIICDKANKCGWCVSISFDFEFRPTVI